MKDEKLLVELARRIQQKYFGKYKGFVQDNKDPKKLGRLKLKIPSVLGEAITEWALPCLPFGGYAEQGFFMVPELNSQVWVEFAEGELSQPIWVGVFWSDAQKPPQEAQLEMPTRRILKTSAGHKLLFDDAKDQEQIVLYHPKNTSISMNAKGDFILTISDKSTLIFEAEKSIIQIEDKENKNKITLNKDGIKITDKYNNQIELAEAVTLLASKNLILKSTENIILETKLLSANVEEMQLMSSKNYKLSAKNISQEAEDSFEVESPSQVIFKTNDFQVD